MLVSNKEVVVLRVFKRSQFLYYVFFFCREYEGSSYVFDINFVYLIGLQVLY